VEPDGSAQLKDMETGEQAEVAIDEVVRDVLRGPAL
jgi:histidyl-tRNA synthetase